MDEYKKERLKDFFSSKQFMLLIVMLVVVVAVGGYYAYSLRQISKITPLPIETNKETTTRSKSWQEDRLPGDGHNLTPTGNMGGDDASDVITPTTPSITEANVQANNEPVKPINASQAAPTVFSLPLGTDIGRDFSHGEMVFNSTLGDWRVHKGVDFQGAIGDTVKAVAAGTVKKVYDDHLWGTVMEIDHGGGILARYCGLGRGSTLAVGTDVKMNDTIGNLGVVPIEKDDIDHLHFEIYVNGALKDPLEILGRD